MLSLSLLKITLTSLLDVFSGKVDSSSKYSKGHWKSVLPCLLILTVTTSGIEWPENEKSKNLDDDDLIMCNARMHCHICILNALPVLDFRTNTI